ncbi:hypothetical protein [Mangrovimonas cancribranchiae]|uniref:Lipoprotein n=1 Tax=Mangrovimonas cancribranchiae TaxID=3080055 RepID=A0AAU6PB14_9FLAO
MSFIVFFLSSCSNNSVDEKIQYNKKTDKVVTTNKTIGICPPGYVPVWEFEVTFTLFKAFTTCSNGFGFCFVRSTITLDCKKRVLTTANYNPVSKSMNVMIEALNDKIARVWIDSNAVSSPDHSLSDFDSMDIGDLELTNGIILKAGVYPKNISGNYFYYDVPFK